MASLQKNGTNYGLVWTDSSREPSQVRESLKTDNYQKAKRLKARLEDQYFTFDRDGNRKHDPWQRKWYEQPSGDGTVITLEEAIKEFVYFKSTTKGQKGWSESIAVKESQFMRMFSEYLGPDLLLSEITEQHLEDFYYKENINSGHTRNSYYISVNTFLNWCVKEGYLEEKPEYKPKKPQSKVPKFIYPKELAQLIEYRLSKIKYDVDEGRLRNPDQGPYWMILAWMLMAGTGMRRGEVVRLTAKNVDSGYITIGEGFTTKTRQERQIPLLFEAKQAIDILTDQNFRQLEPRMRDSKYLLGRSPRSGKDYLSRRFGPLWKERFPDKSKRTLYNLKDMFAVRFLTDPSVPTSEGMKINDLRKILGHQSLDTTQKYLKAIPFGLTITGTIWDYVPTEAFPLTGSQ
ncbi:tyrosine-type recombinase/integrase [Fodinibius sp. SL11]|uniref:tyrosine-type recombinase/integrase n=1 Tax=Fodinibius sp. SL11 TaxID=3425690 RepID=UPI003F8816B5